MYSLLAHAALTEAREVHMYLKPLGRMFEELEEGDYIELLDKIPAVMHVLCLVWANCQHYRQPARLVVLLQEMCNMLIELSRNHLSDEVIRMEPDEGLEKVQETLKVCKVFKDTFIEKRRSIASYFKDTPPVEWEFQSSLVFNRFDHFVERVETVQVGGAMCVSLSVLTTYISVMYCIVLFVSNMRSDDSVRMNVCMSYQ